MTNSTNHAGCDPLDGVRKTRPRRPEAALHWKTRRYAGSDGNDNFGPYLTSYGTRTRPGKSRSAKIKVDRPRRFGWSWQLFLSDYLCVTIMWNLGVWRRLLTLEKVCKERLKVLWDSFFIWTAENKISHRGWRSAEPPNYQTRQVKSAQHGTPLPLAHSFIIVLLRCTRSIKVRLFQSRLKYPSTAMPHLVAATKSINPRTSPDGLAAASHRLWFNPSPSHVPTKDI